jgi:hypothetical protein
MIKATLKAIGAFARSRSTLYLPPHDSGSKSLPRGSLKRFTAPPDGMLRAEVWSWPIPAAACAQGGLAGSLQQRSPPVPDIFGDATVALWSAGIERRFRVIFEDELNATREVFVTQQRS